MVLRIITSLALLFSLGLKLNGQEVNQNSIELEQRSKTGQSKQLQGLGTFELHLYRGAQSLPNQIIVLNKKTKYKTNERGELLVYLPPGQHQVEIKEAQLNAEQEETILSSFELTITEGAPTQAIVTLRDEGDAHVDYFAPPTTPLSSTDLEKHELVDWQGQVIDLTTEQPIEGVRIFLRGSASEVVTDSNGRYQIKVPKDLLFELTFLHKDYSSQAQSYNSTQKEIAKTQLAPASLELAEFIVAAPYVKGSLGALIEIRKNASNVSDVLGSDQIAKAGDSDAAASLKRVTGLTLVDGKYIYIRGLGERYSQTLLNKSSLPSPDPTRRVVPLDMFPSSIIQNLVIQKSYTPDLPGEFAGGAILLETKSLPDDFFLNISTGFSYTDGDNGVEKLSYAGGNKDWSGRDDGTRALSEPLAQAIAGQQRLSECNLVVTTGCFSVEQLTTISKSVKRNSQTLNVAEDAPPSLSVATGNKWTAGSVQMGFLSSLRYSQDWSNETREKNSYNLGNSQTGELVSDKAQIKKSSEREIDLGGTADFGVRIGQNHALNIGLMLMRKTTDEVEVSTGTDADQTNLTFQDTKLRWSERELRTNHLSGSHTLPFLAQAQLDWRYSQATATLEEPDQREYRYYDDGSGYQFETRGDGNRRIYSQLEDKNQDLGFDIKVPFKIFKGDALVKMGHNQVEKNRQSQIRRFKFEEQIAGGLSQDELRGSIDQVLGDQNIGPNGFLLKEDTQPTDNYRATQQLQASYAMIEIPLGKRLRYITGARYERSMQDVTTFKLFDPDNAPDRAALETINILPVHSATLSLTPQMQLRLAYSETVSRPDFKELSTAPYHDVENDQIVVGNNNLVGSVITNIDFRWEWYFKKSENVSVGLFYKEFETPIEAVARNSTEGGITFQNAQEAQNTGAEIEFRKKLDFINESMDRFSVAGNYSFIESSVTIAPENAGLLTSKNRPLQGQSPYVVNAQLLYENPDSGTDLSLLYNVFGERITEVGVLGLPDVFEDPFDQLDFVMRQKLSQNFSLGFKVSNILNPEAIQRQGDKTIQLYEKGRTFSLSLSGRF